MNVYENSNDFFYILYNINFFLIFRKITVPVDNAINDWDTEENLHNLTVDESISSNQETKYAFKIYILIDDES